MYRGFIKNITNLTGNALGSADLRIQSMRIKRDILSKATSEFTVINVPSVAEVGNVFGVYDDYGVTVYLGVITGVDDKTIETDQIISLFDDNWLWYDPQLSSIELTVKRILEDDFAGSTDALQGAIWSQYAISTSSTSAYALPTHENNYVTNFMDFIFSLYENYEILFDINIPYSTGTPTINITKNTATALQLGNNTYALRNFVIDRETVETNKLVVLSEDASTVRGTYYATTSGITSDSTSLDRLPKINTEYEFSDDDINDIIQSNLSSEMYNHKISCELVLGNKLYDFDDFSLGRKCNIFFNGDYYESILTGYEIEIDNEGKAEKAKLIFGKVRYSLEKKLYAESNKDNIQTSNYSLRSRTADEAERATFGNFPYGVSSSSAGTVAKTVTVNDDGFTLETGVQIAVKFNVTNTATNPTLNVNGTGAKGIAKWGLEPVGVGEDQSWKAGATVMLVYNGTKWVIANWWRDRTDDIYLLGDTEHRNHFVTQSAYPSSSAGFVVVATFTINHTYTVGDVYMKLSTYTETTPFEIGIGWASSNTTDPAFNRIFSTGKYQNVYLYKKATSTWELIIEVSNNRPIAVLDYQCGYDGRSSVTVSFAVSRYATMPGTLGTDIFQAIPWSDLYLVPRQFSAVDLNTFTEAGTFYVYNGTTALNFPSGVNGSLIVIKNTTNVGRQIFFRQGTIDSNDHQIWTRQFQISSGTWGKWQRIQEIVEEGTEGNWSYRKYADGKAECWKTVTGSVAITTAWTGGFYRSAVIGTEAFPTGLFTGVPAVFTGVSNTNGTIIFTTGAQQITKDSMSGSVNIHVGSGTYNCTNSFLAIGSWY